VERIQETQTKRILSPLEIQRQLLLIGKGMICPYKLRLGSDILEKDMELIKLLALYDNASTIVLGMSLAQFQSLQPTALEQNDHHQNNEIDKKAFDKLMRQDKMNRLNLQRYFEKEKRRK